MNKTGLIYKCTNISNGKSYIGQTTKTLKFRIDLHFYAANTLTADGYKYNYHFAKALRKYPKHNWEWSIIHDNIPTANLGQYEINAILYYDTFNSGYNSTLGGDMNPMFIPEIANKVSIAKRGIKFTSEHKAKLSLLKKGCKLNLSEDQRNARRQQITGNTYSLGKTHTEETKIKQSLRHRGENNSCKTVLTESTVLSIRALWKEGHLKQRELAEMFGVSRGHIGRLVTNKTWKHLLCEVSE